MNRILAAALVVAVTAGAPAADPPAPRRHFLTVQVTEYAKHTGFAPQRAPKQDAGALPAAFGQSGWKGVHVHLSDAPAAKPADRPTAARVRTALDDLARDARIGPDDEIVLYFSGTGFDAPAGAAFCPSGADPKNPDSMILVDELRQRARLIPARRKLLVIESCRNPLDIKVTLHAPAPPAGDSATRPAGLKKPGAFVVIQSSSEGQYSYNCPDSGFGLLTCQLLKALKSREAARDGEVMVAGVASFLKRTVPKSAAELYSAEQVPLVIDESGVEWVLARLPKSEERDGRVASAPAPPAPAGRAPPVVEPMPAPRPAGGAVAVAPPAAGARPAPMPAVRPVPVAAAPSARPVLQQAARAGVAYGLSKIK